jgi:hypothetical protein
MFEDMFIPIVTQVGFPIAVCFYFILKTEKVIKTNTQALDRIREIIFKCNR